MLIASKPIISSALIEDETTQKEILNSLEQDGKYAFKEERLSSICYIPYYGNTTPLNNLIEKTRFIQIKLITSGLSENIGDTEWWIVKIYENKKTEIHKIKNKIYPNTKITVCTKNKEIYKTEQKNAKEEKIYFEITPSIPFEKE